MNLKEIIHNIQEQRLKDSDAALKNIANSEKYLQQAYEGRYLFELIQNVRDANKEDNVVGSVFIELKNEILIISNTGAPFSEKGINSITTIGDSPKESQEFIGFKGIGFKSVHEISNTPYIITEWGSIVFDKEKTKPFLQERQFIDRDIPLFFIPHYRDEFLTKQDKEDSIVTKVILPLKSKVSNEIIEKGFNEIGVHQILLLGCLKTIELKSGFNQYHFTIDENIKTGKVIIQKNGTSYQFKHFKPYQKIQIPDTIIQNLEDKEREIYQKDPFVDISLIFDLDEKNRLVKNQKSKLYLFYPTEITSGFDFIIHSYFLVTPDRKGLRDSPLNKFVLESIADYISGEWLTGIKRMYKTTFLDFLVFDRNTEAPLLNALYNKLVEKLKTEKILFDHESNKFYYLDEVIIAGGFDKGLFTDNILNGKRLIYIQNKIIRDWLIREFKIIYLSNETIAENIEKECVRQKTNKNFKFFENLYRYLVEYDDLNLKGKKVLFTSRMQLLGSDDYVFYGLKEKIIFPATIQRQINFIHPSIKITDQRQGKGQTGFIEYSTELLVRRLLKLYDVDSIPKIDILISLLKLNISEKLFIEIRQKIMLPVKGKIKWLNAFTNSVYIETEELQALYDAEKFLDISLLNDVNIPFDELKSKLIQLGAWDIPAIYYSNETILINWQDSRYQYLNTLKNYSTSFYHLHGDWLLDKPKRINQWFTETIISQWNNYINRIEDENNPSIKYNSQTSSQQFIPKNQVKNITSFIKYLKIDRWIKIENKDELFNADQVVGIDPIESIQPTSSLVKKYLNAFPIHFASNFSLIQILGIKHLDSKSISDFKSIFSTIYEIHKKREIYDREFKDFYNKVIGKLFDLFTLQTTIKDDITLLSNSIFLAENELTQKLEWKAANQIYYIEDKPAYDLLPNETKAIIQPHFTNRNKNRFGQIAKRIGLDFKKIIQQKLVDVEEIKRLNLWDWLPNFSESLAFTEMLLKINLDSRLDQIKNTQLLLCESFAIDLYKDSKFISKLGNVTHRIEFNEPIQIFINNHANVKQNILFANILHDLLVEILGRDLHPLRLQLNDFYNRADKRDYIDSFEVTVERIDEITNKIKGIILTRKQSFWIDVMNLKNVTNPTLYIKDETINFDKLLPVLRCSNLELLNKIDSIDYNKINKAENIEPLHSLFTEVKINLIEFNKISEVKVDFKEHYQKLIDGLKIKYKAIFQNKVYEYLKDKNIELKSEFQNTIDEYTDFFRLEMTSPILFIDHEHLFFGKLAIKYPYIILSEMDVTVSETTSLSSIYRKNLSSFKKTITESNSSKLIRDDFIANNSNRSLLYFDDTIDELITRFNQFSLTKQENGIADESSEINSLNAYSNLLGAVIEEATTESIGTTSTSNNATEVTTGKRIDGSRINPNLELLGRVAEKIVFEKLSETYPVIEWVSKNAAKAGVNPEGSDVYGCDIKYLDITNEIHFVEVKAKMDNQKHFYISYPEYKKALTEKENYHIYLVLFTLDNYKRRILHLGNIFLFNENDDIFSNSKFTANFNSLEIRFK